ncbi:PREDICTED: cation/H(+) antiporter 15-like [Prunus mume]|uniref:Cation/H(+) antiporter 15-like n=1 Tax=Prunus mume TaxID=102107 RepID=A0ABM0NYI1_PRUMU|nr:PREDICTED: cation/H(+) antiporter 15-like [Prunus mume]
MGSVTGTRSYAGESYTVFADSKDELRACYNKTISPTGLWRVENPLMQALPVTVIKLVMAMVSTRLAMLLLKPFYQPRIVADILGGFLMSRNMRGDLYPQLFPISNTVVAETLANLALVYHMFLVGLELDFKPILRARRKAVSIALTGMVFSFLTGWVLYRYILLKDFAKQTKNLGTKDGSFFWGITLATTNFLDLAKILADLKLLYSDVGGLALSASVISDLCSWILLLLGMAVVKSRPLLTVGSTLAFVGLCVFVVRPALVRIINRRRGAQENGNDNELACYVMAGVVLCGLITDACGSHSIVGPFVLGIIIPKGEFSSMLIENMGNFVRGILMPFFYLINSRRLSFQDILNTKDPEEAKTGTNIYRVVLINLVAYAAKIVSTFVACLLNKMSPRDSLTVGVLMNTKGLLALIILNSARDLKILNKQSFTLMMVVIWITTFFVGPFLALFYKSSARPLVQYKQRNVRSVGPNTELRILACTHTSRKMSGIIDLIDSSNPTEKSPIHVIVTHLVELTGHASAMLVVHNTCKPSSTNTTTSDTHSTDYDSSNGFQLYAQQREGIVTVQTITAVSPYATMHEDICNLAEENRVSLIIIPFHKQSAISDGGAAIQDSNYSHLKSLNNNLIAHARCSVGVFVDHGLGTSNSGHHFAILFIGGEDDREALAYAGRMVGHPKVMITVIRFNFNSNKGAPKVYSNDNGGDGDSDSDSDGDGDGDDEILEAMTSTGKQKKLDDLFIDEFRLRSMSDDSLEYLEKSVTSWEQTLTLISAMEGDYDMFIVGRSHGSNSNETSTMLLECSDSNEMGVLGDALVSSTFSGSTSILVVQHGEDLDIV